MWVHNMEHNFIEYNISNLGQSKHTTHGFILDQWIFFLFNHLDMSFSQKLISL